MKKIRLLAAALALTLLAGCGTTAAEPDETPAADEHGDDMVYQLIGITKDTPMLTVDGTPVSAETTLFWMAQGVSSWVSGAGIGLESDWSQAYGATGMTIGEAVKADVLSTIEYFQVIENKARELGVTFTAEEEAEIAAEFASLIESSGGEEAFQSRLKQMCISREGFENLNRISYLYEVMADKLAFDGKLDEDYTMEDFLEEKGIYAAKHILLSTRRINEEGTGYEDFSDEEKAAVKAQIDGLRSQLADAGDSADLFDQLMNQYSEDGRDENGDLYAPEGYTYVYSLESVTNYAQMAMVPEFEAGAKALKVGEISQPVQTDYGYHLILRIDVDTAQATEDMLDTLIGKWVDGAKVETTPAYDDLDAKAFYQNLQEKLAAEAD